MSVINYPGMDDCNHTNQLHTIAPSVAPAGHEISVPPLSPDMSKMLPPPTPPTKGKEMEKDASKVGGLLIDLADNGSEDGPSPSTEKDTGTIPSEPRMRKSRTIP
jgi:hypothetical protein